MKFNKNASIVLSVVLLVIFLFTGCGSKKPVDDVEDEEQGITGINNENEQEDDYVIIGNEYGTTYYVSFSEGDDTYDGKSPTTPWKTLSKVSSTEFNAGDMILLESGDTWSGEELLLKGNGTEEHAITLSSYGKGDKPVIKSPSSDSDEDLVYNIGSDPRSSLKVAIKIKNYTGWRIKDIEISNAEYGIIAYNKELSLDSKVYIEDCYIHDISGGRLLQSGDNPYPLLIKSDGIFVYGYTPVVKDVKIERAVRGMGVINCKDILIDNFYGYDLYTEGIHFHTVYGGSFQNSKVLHVGYPDGVWHGVAGIFIGQSYDLTLKDSEIGDVYDSGHDGVGIDYEGINSNVTTLRCYVHDCYSAAFLIFDVGGKKLDNEITRIIDCVIDNNGLKDPSTLPALLRHYSNKKSGGVIAGNQIRKASKDQAVNDIYILNMSDSNLTDDFPRSYAVKDNKIYEKDDDMSLETKEDGEESKQTKWVASQGFSEGQGNNQWYYQQWSKSIQRRDSSKYAYLIWNSGDAVWMDNSSSVQIGGDYQMPDIDYDAVRNWVAPRDCRISIAGRAKKADSGGDGVNVKIIKNDNKYFGVIEGRTTVFGSISIGGSNVNPIDTNVEVDVRKGDIIRFIVNANEKPDNDKVIWDPEINIIKIYDQNNPFPQQPLTEEEKATKDAVNEQNEFDEWLSNLQEGTYWLASEGFSEEQGKNQWYYEQWDGNKYSQMKWDSGQSIWHGEATYVFVGQNWQHPETGFDSVRKWVAPKAGEIIIRGIAKKGSGGGDGVILSIKKNDEVILEPTNLEGDNINGIEIDISTNIDEGDVIYFIVNKKESIDFDGTTWDQVIVYK